jgi:hypothetical protein
LSQARFLGFSLHGAPPCLSQIFVAGRAKIHSTMTDPFHTNDPSGSVEQLIHSEAVRLDAYLRSVPELLSRSGKKLRRV